MSSILIVQKDGNIKETIIKNMKEDELYKKAGFRSSEGFKLHTSWTVHIKNRTYSIHVYGKTDGKANQENKYEFPPPIDNTMFFGSCLIVNKNGEQIENLTTSEWEAIYDNLYGGFEDLNSEDESDAEDDDDDVPKTKSGYVKDGFIVDDDEEDDDEEDDEEEEDEEEDEEEEEEEDDDDEIVKPKRKLPKRNNKQIKKVIKKYTKTIPATIFKVTEKSLVNTLDCTHELCEEEYIEE